MDDIPTFNDQKLNDFINNLSLFVFKNKSKVNEAYEYFKSADADIKAAELLYNIKINSLALFHLQQATEKILDGIIESIYFCVYTGAGVKLRERYTIPRTDYGLDGI